MTGGKNADVLTLLSETHEHKRGSKRAAVQKKAATSLEDVSGQARQVFTISVTCRRFERVARQGGLQARTHTCFFFQLFFPFL